ncbi:Chaperone SurA [Usitatibacter rugosus]|uniref:Chaperone SurA n=1 Tax=Usitatibacter rugosus TaxID=2732067 RepID=A0A6M4GQE9_9PROT|nr:peptidylprolyl isomerase [Usitatibacter rugosus]QJR09362.1 Chaperone SurA [Usitatibacter rugosus]
MRHAPAFLAPLILAAAAAQAQAPAAPAAPASPSAPKLDQRLSTTPSRIVPIDRIVAVVNDEVVTQNDLNERVALVANQLRKGGAQVPPQDALQRQILERMINDLVQVQMAKETGIRVDDATLDRTIGRIAQENNLSMGDFRLALEKDGVNYTRFRDDIRSEILLARLREREIDNTLVVTDAEVETELLREAREKTTDAEFRLSHVLVMVPAQATPDQIEVRRRRALAALSELRKGTNFAQVAAQFSDAPDALQGGNLGWRPSARLPSLFLEAIEKLQPGEVSNIVRSPNGFHIVKLLEKRGKAATAGIQQSRVRHILVRSKEGVTDTEIRERLARLRERATTGTDFGELARVNSEDSSAAKGGDLGWVAPGDTVPEFERAMNALAAGEISQPVQTPFGWHLIQVQERRSDELSEDRKKLAARQAIRARKGDEAYADWLRQARDRAFVENRLDDR